MTDLIISDIDPRHLVSANVKLHRAVAGKLRAQWRRVAHEAAIAAYGTADEGEHWHQRVRIVLTFRFPTRRRRDTPNLYSYVAKPIVDGLVDARLIPDDDDFHVIGPDMRRDPDRGPLQIRIDIEDLPPLHTPEPAAPAVAAPASPALATGPSTAGAAATPTTDGGLF